MGTKFSSRTGVLLLADIVAVLNGILLAMFLRLGEEGTYYQLYENNGWLKIFFAACVWLVALYFHDLYDYQILSSRDEIFFRTIQAVGIAWVSLALIYYLIPRLEIGPGTALYAIALTLTVLLGVRLAFFYVMDHPEMGERILIVGEGPEVGDTIRAVTERRAAGYRIIGFLGDQQAGAPAAVHALPVARLGRISELERIVNDQRIDRIVVGVRQRRGVFPADALLRLRLNGDVLIDECASFYETVSGKVHLDMVRPSWLIFSQYSRNTQIKAGFRDLVHRSLAFVGLIVSLPVAVLTAILIKIESPGPIFYRQVRVGKNDRHFEVIKFRSMRSDAEAGGTPIWASPNDDRVTVVGKFIRKVRIDEIPQFWNILKGEMRFVGPRPERPHFVEQLAREIPFYEHRHLVAPGLTGWAQVKYPYGASVEDARQKLQYDLYYIKNQTLLLDLMIVLQTVKIILLGKGGR